MERTEALESLKIIDEAMAQTRRAIAHSGSGYFFIIWGIVWLVGFLGNELLVPPVAGYLWLALDVLGLAGSVIVGIRMNRQVRSPEGKRTGLRAAALWGLLMVYGVVLYWAASPPPDRFSLFVTLFIGFAYAIAGLWISTPLLLTGLGISALAAIVWIAAPGLLPYALSLLGGGGMIAVGAYMLRAWK